MTKVEIFNHDGRIHGFSVSGHSGYAEEGSDIVCAAVSAAVTFAECTINDVLGNHANTKVKEEEPRITLTLPAACDDEDAVQAYEVLKDYIVHVHCKDRNVDPALTGEHRYNRGLLAAAVGSGYLPMKEILDRLKESGYEDYLAIEHFNAADQVAFMEQSAAFLQQYL